MALNRFTFLLCLGLMVLVLGSHFSEGAQRKPPFNGSIFGKRASAVAGFDGSPAADRLYAACAMAVEACSQIYQSTES